MYESLWVKTLFDKTIELGTDTMIKNNLASWSRGRQDILEASLFYRGTKLTVSANPKIKEGSFKQFDTFEFNSSSGESKRLSRSFSLPCAGYKYFVHKTNSYFSAENFKSEFIIQLNNESGFLVPEDASKIVCSIQFDGNVYHRWS